VRSRLAEVSQRSTPVRRTSCCSVYQHRYVSIDTGSSGIVSSSFLHRRCVFDSTMTADTKNVYGYISRYAKATWRGSLCELSSTFGVLALCWWINDWWIMPLCGFTMLRLFIQFHDMSHLSFFPSNAWNVKVGTAVGGMVLTPFGYWKHHHDYHHKHSNDLNFLQLSQTCPLTLKQYQALPRWQQLYYSFVTHRLMMLSFTPILVWVFFISRYRRRDLVWFFSYLAISYFTGRLWMQATGCWLAAIAGVYLFHMQHTFMPTVRAADKDYFDNGLHGSSFAEIPEFLKWFTCGIEYHHVHHLNAKVPSYLLRECHENEENGLFKEVVHLDFMDGFHMLKFNVWDEDTQSFTRAVARS